MFSCLVCNASFDNKMKLSGHKRIHTSKVKASLGESQRLKMARNNYYLSPRSCLECNEVISYEDVRSNWLKKFCNSSCAAKFNNKQRGSRSEETKLAISKALKGEKLPFYMAVDKRGAKKFFGDSIVGEFSVCVFNICKHCGKSFTSKTKRKYCNEHEFLYKEKKRNLFKFTFNPFKFTDIFDEEDLGKLKKVGFWSPTNTKGMTRDHKVSVNVAIKRSLDPYYIKHPLNCELMGWIENNKKKTRCSMSYEDLILAVDEYESRKVRKGMI